MASRPRSAGGRRDTGQASSARPPPRGWQTGADELDSEIEDVPHDEEFAALFQQFAERDEGIIYRLAD
ncbi:MAG: hypothetical protein JJE52_11400 [Acidimicrobiia bacterium]|nr:hypothetical protein [Acidimicrobiia bacterium]